MLFSQSAKIIVYLSMRNGSGQDGGPTNM